jgi:hypothetical protein
MSYDEECSADDCDNYTSDEFCEECRNEGGLADAQDQRNRFVFEMLPQK